MRDQGWIYAGLIVFLGLVTFPVSWNVAAHTSSKAPVLKPATGKQCVMPVEYMRRSHMDMLVTWRDQVVRKGIRTFTATGGRTFDMSLTSTCLRQCHSSKEEFCDRCHTYVGVKGPYCMNCHLDPKQVPMHLAEAKR